MAANLGHLARAATAILWLMIFHVAPSDSRAQARGSGSTGVCISRERDALLSFKAGLLDLTGRLSSWRGEDCCQWKGVRCSNRTGHVIKLDLRNSNINSNPLYDYPNKYSLSLSRDEMSSSLAALQQLRYLDLSYNYFNGTSIPVFVGSLERLSYLNLSWSGFDGRIPSQLGNLSNLEYLDVSWNHFYDMHTVDLAWLPRLSLLSNLDMSSLNLSAVRDWVDIVNRLSSLEVLRLQDCGLTSTMSATSKSNHTQLQVLDLSMNWFNTSVEHKWFWDLTSLKELYLSSCGWHGSIPEELGNMTYLEVIDLSANYHVGLIPGNLENLCHLEVLDFGQNNMNGSIGEFMDRLPRCSRSSIEVLLVYLNSMTGKLPIWIGNMTSLSIFSVFDNMITGTVPSSFCQLTSLERLDLSKNNLTGDVMQCGKESDNSSSMFSTNSADQFGSIMIILDLSNNDLSGEFPKFLQSFLRLRSLDLSYNRFFGALPKWLPKKMPQLRVLMLRSNMFSSHIPKNLTCLENLHYLDIAHNNISGVIPWSLSDLKAMRVISQIQENYFLEESIQVTTKGQTRDYNIEIYMLLVNLDLSCNSLTGQIPEEISFLLRLMNLNLSSNQLVGGIPNHIGDLKHLESLDLSYNKLSSEIPSNLSALTSLSHLNLSYNNLSGTIPSGQQLQVLDNMNYTYIGNPGLCGYPLSKNCSTSTTGVEQSVNHEDADHVVPLYLGIITGFVVGLWTVFCTMLTRRAWVIAYFQIIDKLYDEVYVRVAIAWARMMKKTRDETA